MFNFRLIILFFVLLNFSNLNIYSIPKNSQIKNRKRTSQNKTKSKQKEKIPLRKTSKKKTSSQIKKPASKKIKRSSSDETKKIDSENNKIENLEENDSKNIIIENIIQDKTISNNNSSNNSKKTPRKKVIKKKPTTPRKPREKPTIIKNIFHLNSPNKNESVKKRNIKNKAEKKLEPIINSSEKLLNDQSNKLKQENLINEILKKIDDLKIKIQPNIIEKVSVLNFDIRSLVKFDIFELEKIKLVLKIIELEIDLSENFQILINTEYLNNLLKKDLININKEINTKNDSFNKLLINRILNKSNQLYIKIDKYNSCCNKNFDTTKLNGLELNYESLSKKTRAELLQSESILSSIENQIDFIISLK